MPPTRTSRLSKGVHLPASSIPTSAPAFRHPPWVRTPSAYTGVTAPFPESWRQSPTPSAPRSPSIAALPSAVRKRMSHRFLFDANYTYSVDKDDDSNERDPFTFRYAEPVQPRRRNIPTPIATNATSSTSTPSPTLPWGFEANVRMQAHSAQPITDNVNGTGTGATVQRTTIR